MSHWQRAAVVFSVGWIIALALYVGIPAYRELTCKPIVRHLADGTIMEQACVHVVITQRVGLYVAGYAGGGIALVALLSWLFLGPPADRFASRWRHRNRRVE